MIKADKMNGSDDSDVMEHDEEMQVEPTSLPSPQLIHRRNSSRETSGNAVAFAAEDEEIPAPRIFAAFSGGSDDDSDDNSFAPNEESGDRRANLKRTPSMRQSTKNLRSSLVTDMATGKVGGRAQYAQIRRQTSKGPRSAGERSMMNLKHFFTAIEPANAGLPNRVDPVPAKPRVGIDFQSSRDKTYHYSVSSRSKDGNNSTSGATSNSIQYCLRALPPPSSNPKWMQWLGFGESRLTIYEANSNETGLKLLGHNPNKIVINFLHWTFRQSFPTMILVAMVAFFFFTILFALAIWFAGRRHPHCIGGVSFENDFFVDAFMLSWTTFSTVGYGLVYSGISTSEDVGDIKDCTGITVLVAFESFVGILFASMCGAILFTKVARIQSFAQVTFSDPVCIRYGSGVKIECEEDEDEDCSQSTGDGDLESLPCPILEFRVVNRLHSIAGGEIIDASMGVVAAIDAAQACPTVTRGLLSRRRRGGKKGKRRRPRPQVQVQRTEEAFPSMSDMSGEPTIPELTLPPISGVVRPTQSFDEDPTGHLIPKRIITKLECESQDHPFFKRVWIVRHKLNHVSPLLRAHARHMVKKNRGYWPKELNSADGIRAAIHFDQLLISMSGTSNADANSVYAQKVYEFADVNVGYRFVNMLFRDKNDGHLRVDTGLLNDVMEQAGGGGEEFEAIRANTLEMLVL